MLITFESVWISTIDSSTSFNRIFLKCSIIITKQILPKSIYMIACFTFLFQFFKLFLKSLLFIIFIIKKLNVIETFNPSTKIIIFIFTQLTKCDVFSFTSKIQILCFTSKKNITFFYKILVFWYNTFFS